jgi:hypothetical protein
MSKTALAATPEEAYELIAQLARDHALIHNAFGGVIVVVHPKTQREQGIYEHIQYVHGLGPHPTDIKAPTPEAPAAPDVQDKLERAGQLRLIA